METIWMIQEAPALGNSDSFITTDNMPDRASRLVQRSFGKISNRVGDSAPLQSDLVLFPKQKSPLKGKRFYRLSMRFRKIRQGS